MGAVENFAGGSEKAGASIVGAVIQNIRGMFDHQHGGFGSTPKFPHPSALDLLLDAYLETY